MVKFQGEGEMRARVDAGLPHRAGAAASQRRVPFIFDLSMRYIPAG
jgi:hypothetical protein